MNGKCQPEKQRQPQSPAQPAGEFTWEEIRAILNRFAQAKSEWAGCPLPITGTELVIEPRYPLSLDGKKLPADDDESRFAEHMAEIGRQFDFGDGTGTINLINVWHSRAKQAGIWVYDTGDGRSRVAIRPNRKEQRVDMSLLCMGPFNEGAWSIKAEMTAMQKLRDHVGDYKFGQYLLTGGFLETSPRSKVTYWFRRLRPTVAFRGTDNDRIRILAALCLHPIGYYRGSYAGVMVPTDDVIAHLLLMRGDEHEFWKQANQHPVESDAAGV